MFGTAVLRALLVLYRVQCMPCRCRICRDWVFLYRDSTPAVCGVQAVLPLPSTLPEDNEETCFGSAERIERVISGVFAFCVQTNKTNLSSTTTAPPW